MDTKIILSWNVLLLIYYLVFVDAENFTAVFVFQTLPPNIPVPIPYEPQPEGKVRKKLRATSEKKVLKNGAT